MRITLDVPDQLADVLHALATQRGVTIRALGEQALAIGLAALAAESGELVDVGSAQVDAPRLPATVSARSPIIIRGPIRPLQIALEPAPETPSDAH